ncbi:MAG: peptidylprolyl isomerase [Phycisphaerales bacterium]|nr:peptidylprolyl isomerase [Phycisphaerales bacterium]
MTSAFNWMIWLSACAWTQFAPDNGAESLITEPPLSSQVRAELRLDKTVFPVGSPILAEFIVRNRTGEQITLTVPGALKAKAQSESGMGLPFEHVFSGIAYRGLEVASEHDPQMGHRVSRKPQYPVSPITLAPYASVGLRFDIARFYPGLHQSGIYELIWKPYGGRLETRPLLIKVVAYKQAVIETDQGAMTMRLLYDKAPKHVENFIELADRRFYNGTSFHTLFPSQFILGGCPQGDGTGKRPDGLMLEPEFNDTPFDLGTIGMALVEGDLRSASCQFFICLSRQPGWDGRYTAFGEIRGPESLATLRRLGQLQSDEDRRPVRPIKIKSITVVDVPYVPRSIE